MAVLETEVAGRTFRVRQFGARDGSFIAFKIAGLMAPLMALGSAAGASPEAQMVNMLPMLGAATQQLSEADFAYIQGKCLAAVDEKLPAGWRPLLNQNGSFGVPDMEENAPLALRLTIQALTHNLSGFFADGGLADLLGGLLTSSPPT